MAQHPDTSLSGASLHSALAPLLPAQLNAAEESSTGLVVEIYEHHVPAFAAQALDRLYGSLFASHRHLQLCEDGHAAPHTWVAYRCGEIAGVLLFRIEALRVLVLTEMFVLDDVLAASFCQSVFARYCAPHIIVFNAVSLRVLPAALPCQHFVFSENYVIDLPDSVETYRDRLGKSTRKTLKGYGNRLLRDYPELEWRAFSAAELPRHEQRTFVRQLQAFKRASMAARGKHALADTRDTARMLMMASESGLFGMATLHGKLCAGSLACRVGDSYVMLLSASDPAFSAYRLGMLSCYWAICDCIRRGARQCHLLWGRYQYKEQLLAQPQWLHRLTIYRSRWRQLSSPLKVLDMSWQGWRHRLRRWLLNELPGRSDPGSRLLMLNLAAARHWLANRRREAG